MYQLKTDFNYSGELTESSVKYRLFTQVNHVKNWAGECNHAFLSQQAIRPTRRASVEKALSREGYGWHTSPKGLLLDLYWGIDAPVFWKGHHFGIDITTKSGTADIRKKVALLNHCQYLNETPLNDVDATAVWILEECPSVDWMINTIKQMSKQSHYCAIYTA